MWGIFGIEADRKQGRERGMACNNVPQLESKPAILCLFGLMEWTSCAPQNTSKLIQKSPPIKRTKYRNTPQVAPMSTETASRGH